MDEFDECIGRALRLQESRSITAKDWQHKLAHEIEKEIINRDCLEHFRQKVEEWHQWIDEQIDLANHWGKQQARLNIPPESEQPNPHEHFLPLPSRAEPPMNLLERYASLAAVHDCVVRNAEKIGTPPPKDTDCWNESNGKWSGFSKEFLRRKRFQELVELVPRLKVEEESPLLTSLLIVLRNIETIQAKTRSPKGKRGRKKGSTKKKDFADKTTANEIGRLRFIKGLSYKKIAEHLGINPKTNDPFSESTVRRIAIRHEDSHRRKYGVRQEFNNRERQPAASDDDKLDFWTSDALGDDSEN